MLIQFQNSWNSSLAYRVLRLEPLSFGLISGKTRKLKYGNSSHSGPPHPFYRKKVKSFLHANLDLCLFTDRGGIWQLSCEWKVVLIYVLVFLKGFRKNSRNRQNDLFNNLKMGFSSQILKSKRNFESWLTSSKICHQTSFLTSYLGDVTENLECGTFPRLLVWSNRVIFKCDINPTASLKVSWWFMHFRWYLSVKTLELCLITWPLMQISELGR